MMHLDSVKINLDGSMTISLKEYDLNPTVAPTFFGATPTVQITNPFPSELDILVTLVPASPIVEQTILMDPGGSASVDG